MGWRGGSRQGLPVVYQRCPGLGLLEVEQGGAQLARQGRRPRQEVLRVRGQKDQGMQMQPL